MLRDDAVSLIAKRLGNRTDLDSVIVAEMQLAQAALETEDYLPHFLLNTIYSATTTSGDDSLALPSDFLREYEQGAMWLYDTTDEYTWTPLPKRTIDELYGAFSSAGAPQYYSLDGEYLHFGPVPDATYTLKFFYYKTDTVLSSNVENQWLKYAPRLLIARTGVEVATYLQNAQMVQVFGLMAQDAYNKFIQSDEARRHANVNYRMEYK